jgi:predicted membrane channel-forming protein YqfA (hemolysin III family)
MSLQRFSLAALLLGSLFQLCAAEGEGKPEPLQIVLFMFFGIGVGIVFMQVLNKMGDPIPYTVAVFIAGILFSLANRDGTGADCFLFFRFIEK